MSLFQDLSHDGELARHLKANGRPATAIITSLADSGLTLGGAAVLDLDLDVSVSGAATYPVSHRQAVTAEQHTRVLPGQSVEARVDPDRPAVLLLLL